MYLLGEVGEYPYQAELWRMRTTRRLVLHELTPAEIDRMAVLMELYRTRAMAFACWNCPARSTAK